MEIKTLKGLIRYCFYKDDEEKVHFGFNECWEVEEDDSISKELIEKLKKICPNIMETDIDYDDNDDEGGGYE